jgi:E3 ubiquitin-protein ligase TRIP12
MRDKNEGVSVGDPNEPSGQSDDSDASGAEEAKSVPAPDTAMIKEETSTSAAVPSDENAATSSSEPPPDPPAIEPTLASLMGGADFQFGAYMASLGSRLKTILTNIKPSADPTTRLLALQDLSEILSMSTEDNLNGYFSQDNFVKELVHIMGGPRKNDDDEAEDENTEENSPDPEDEDAALAAALALSGGGVMGEENLEEQLLACRCLANLMEAMPGSAHTLVYHGAVQVLCSKLLQITFIDLAEQTISVSGLSNRLYHPLTLRH